MPQPSWLLAPKPEATVSTQAAVLMEAGAAAGANRSTTPACARPSEFPPAW